MNKNGGNSMPLMIQFSIGGDNGYFKPHNPYIVISIGKIYSIESSDVYRYSSMLLFFYTFVLLFFYVCS